VSWEVAPRGAYEQSHVRWGRLHVVVMSAAFSQMRVQGWVNTGSSVEVLTEW